MASSARIDELRKKFEENPRRYFAPLANEYRKAGDLEQAIAICREYLPQQPGHMSGHIVYGQALYEFRQFEEAKAVFETALSLDPENLIALRHLGDIALIINDAEGARGWYRRVLEADPRNEEIQAQLAALDRAASTAPTPAITPAITAPTPAASVTPALGNVAQAASGTPAPPSAPTVVMHAVSAPAAAAAQAPAAPKPVVTATSPTAEIRLDDIVPTAAPAAEAIAHAALDITTTSLAESGSGSAASAPGGAMPTGALEGLEATSAGIQDAPPLDGFSLDGLETTSLSEPPPPAPVAVADSQPSALPDLELGSPEGPAAEPEQPPAELPLLDLASPAAPSAQAEPPATVPVPTLDLDMTAPVPESEAPLDLEISLPNVPAPATELRAPPSPPVSEVVAEPAAPSSGPFVTETMAELYLQQGHREEALRVYRALLEQRPGVAALADKVRQLENVLSPAPATYTPVDSGAASAPTIRELLAVIAARRPGHRLQMPEGNGTPAPAPTEQPSAHSLEDSIGPALGFVQPSPGDEAAAVMLARAFASNGHPAELLEAGMPAHPAPSALSLDTVFKTEASAPPPSSFSFDQFFSQRASADHATSAGAETAAAESAAEITQFTQWLEGLKRR